MKVSPAVSNKEPVNETLVVTMADHFVIRDAQSHEVIRRGRGVPPLPVSEGDDE